MHSVMRMLLLSFSVVGVFAGSAVCAAEVPASGKPQFMFVQSAKAVSYHDGKLTLKGVAPATVFFSDRPDRIVGHMTTADFIPFWSKGQDSFLKDNPNASLSVFRPDAEPADIELTLKNPQLNAGDLSYEVVVLNGSIPANGAEATLFIDVIGMPLTPYSYAGADRRAWRRY